jgi:ribosomal protein L31
VKNLLLLSIGICFLALGIWLIFNEYNFRQRAVAVDGRAAGFKRRSSGLGEDALNESYHQEVIFTCPFTNKKRQVTSTIGNGRLRKYEPNVTVKVYILPEPPHRYRVGSPMYLLGSSVTAMGVIWLVATYFR